MKRACNIFAFTVLAGGGFHTIDGKINYLNRMKRRMIPQLCLALFLVRAVPVFPNDLSSISHALQVPDSLALFRNITDIGKQIERQTTSWAGFESPGPAVSVLLSDTMKRSSFTESDLLAQQGNALSIGLQIPDSLFLRTKSGTLRLPEKYYDPEAMRGLTFRDTLFYNPLFLPMIFNGKILPRELSFFPIEENKEQGVLIPIDKTFAPQLKHFDFIWNVRNNYYRTYPDNIRYSVLDFDTIPSLTRDEEVKETFDPFRDPLKVESTVTLQKPGVEGVTIKRKYWVHSGEHSFQFAENYFSDNWHRGGTNNLNFNSFHVFNTNYNKNKIKINNRLEWRLSLFNAPDDSMRHYRIGNDLIRYYGDVSIDAFKHWSYTMNLEAKSQVFNNYLPNSMKIRSAFLAPLYVNSGIGLKYVLDKKSQTVRHRRVKWDLSIAPMSLNFKYIGNDSLDVKRFGIPEGKKSQLDLGTTITSILNYDFTRYINWNSRLTYFTSYHKVVSEFENTLNLSLSNAFSTRVYLILRFDDSVPPDSKMKLLQLSQTLSFGLNYKW